MFYPCSRRSVLATPRRVRLSTFVAVQKFKFQKTVASAAVRMKMKNGDGPVSDDTQSVRANDDYNTICVGLAGDMPRATASHARRCASTPTIENMLGNADTRGDSLNYRCYRNLNHQVYMEIKQQIESDPLVDLSAIVAQYQSYAAEIGELSTAEKKRNAPAYSRPEKTRKHIPTVHSTPVDPDSECANLFRKTLSVLNTAQQGSKSEMYQAMTTIFSAEDRRKHFDSLEDFLANNPAPEEEVNAEFRYINPEEVLKTKGNSIHGPRREDVGKFNRKLFEMQCRQYRGHLQLCFSINPYFFREMNTVLSNSEIIRTDYVEMRYFDNGVEKDIGTFMLIVHKTTDGIMCTVKNSACALFESLAQGSFCSKYSKYSSQVLFLYFDTFILYNVVFLTEKAAQAVNDLFFSQS